MQTLDVATQPVPYGEVLADNIRAARARAKLSQMSAARRMRAFGFKWHFQTMGACERNERPVSAAEIPALALAFGTTPEALTRPSADVPSVLFGDQVIPAQRLSINDDSVSWAGDEPRVSPVDAAREEAAYIRELAQAPLPGYDELRRRLAIVEELLTTRNDQKERE